MTLLDTRNRPLHDLRISVTDRCNFRCVYCMPKEIYGKGYQFLQKDQLLTFEELARLAAVFASLGTKKVRLTGGEPLMRRGLEGLILRFIEYMDVGHTNGWRLEDVVSAREIVRTIDAELPLLPAEANYRGEVAERWRYADGSGEIGVIASVTQPFCADCTRARLSADGGLYTCLFATTGRDLRGLVRAGASDDAIRDAIAETWTERADRYSEQRSSETADLHKIEMS